MRFSFSKSKRLFGLSAAEASLHADRLLDRRRRLPDRVPGFVAPLGNTYREFCLPFEAVGRGHEPRLRSPLTSTVRLRGPPQCVQRGRVALWSSAAEISALRLQSVQMTLVVFGPGLSLRFRLLISRSTLSDRVGAVWLGSDNGAFCKQKTRRAFGLRTAGRCQFRLASTANVVFSSVPASVEAVFTGAGPAAFCSATSCGLPSRTFPRQSQSRPSK